MRYSLLLWMVAVSAATSAEEDGEGGLVERGSQPKQDNICIPGRWALCCPGYLPGQVGPYPLNQRGTQLFPRDDCKEIDEISQCTSDPAQNGNGNKIYCCEKFILNDDPKKDLSKGQGLRCYFSNIVVPAQDPAEQDSRDVGQGNQPAVQGVTPGLDLNFNLFDALHAGWTGITDFFNSDGTPTPAGGY